MITSLSHTVVFVLDQDEALEFYTEKLGCRVHTDATTDGGYRWLTVGLPDDPEHQLILTEPRPPLMDEETGEQVKALVAKGVLGPGVLRVDDCRATYKELSDRGVNFLSEPEERPYGIEATMRDNSGNWFSMTEPNKQYAKPQS